MLEDERAQIDAIDEQLTALIEQRLIISEKIAAYKYRNHMSLTHRQRELAVIETQTAKLADATLAPYLKTFYEDVMLLSKQYQANVIKQMKANE